jgi:hypothetical protein
MAAMLSLLGGWGYQVSRKVREGQTICGGERHDFDFDSDFDFDGDGEER